MNIPLTAFNIALIIVVGVLLPRLLRRLSSISLASRLLWYAGVLVLLIAPCLASDVFKTKAMFTKCAYLLAAYCLVTVSFLKEEKVLRLD